MAEYTYQIVDLRTGTFLAEVSLFNVNFTRLLNDSGKFQGTLLVDSSLSFSGVDAYDITTPCRRAVYVLRDGVPLWGGVIWTRKYDSISQHLDIGAADWWSYFDSRKVIPVLPIPLADTTYVAGRQVQFLATDQNNIARLLVQLASQHTGGDIKIVLDTSLTGFNRDRTYLGYDLSNVGEMLRQLSTVINGPDIMFDIALDSSGNIIRRMLVGKPSLGQQGSPNIWEYGGNIQSYTWPSDGSKMATREYAVGNGTGVLLPIAVSEDAARYTLGWPLLEAEQGYNTVTDPSILQSHSDADLTASRAPVVLPVLTVRADVPPILGTYIPGDDAQVIIQDSFLVSGLNSLMRIVQIAVKPDPVQGEQVVLTMSPGIDEVTY